VRAEGLEPSRALRPNGFSYRSTAFAAPALCGKVWGTATQAPRQTDHVFDGSLRMTSLSHGDVVNGVYKSAKSLFEQQDAIAEKYKCVGDYEPRMLRIPGLLITTVWLKSQTPNGADWVVPLHTKIGALQKEQMYTLGEFLNITKPWLIIASNRRFLSRKHNSRGCGRERSVAKRP